MNHVESRGFVSRNVLFQCDLQHLFGPLSKVPYSTYQLISCWRAGPKASGRTSHSASYRTGTHRPRFAERTDIIQILIRIPVGLTNSINIIIILLSNIGNSVQQPLHPFLCRGKRLRSGCSNAKIKFLAKMRRIMRTHLSGQHEEHAYYIYRFPRDLEFRTSIHMLDAYGSYGFPNLHPQIFWG